MCEDCSATYYCQLYFNSNGVKDSFVKLLSPLLFKSFWYQKSKKYFFIHSDEESEMNFAAFSAVGATGTHFVTTGAQLPVTKIQQNVSNNGNTLSQVIEMLQYFIHC